MAFLSDRKAANAEPKVPNRREKEDIENAVAQVYVVSAQGGEAFAVSFSDEDVHSFAWSADSQRIYFATRNRSTEQQKDEHRKEWKDVVQFRESERGDMVFGIKVAFAAPHTTANASRLARPEPATVAAKGQTLPLESHHKPVHRALGIERCLPASSCERRCPEEDRRMGHA